MRTKIFMFVVALAVGVFFLGVDGCSKDASIGQHSGNSKAVLKQRLLQCYATSKADFTKGVSLYERGKLKQAEDVFESIIKRCPESPFGWHGRAIIALKRQDSDAVQKNELEMLKRLDELHAALPQMWQGYEEFLAGVGSVLGKGDIDSARRHYKKSCDMKEGRGCTNLGSIIERKEKDTDKAYELYVLGCKYGYGRACTNKGVIEEKIKDKPLDALQSYRSGCRLEHKTGCRNAANLLMKIDPKNTNEILELFKRGCELGDSVSCEMFSQLQKDGNLK